MAKSLFWLLDEAWKALSPHLPRGRPGKPRVDDRTVISGILHVLKTGCRWRDVPPLYGPPTTIYNRYNRWSQLRVWQRIFEKMAAAGPIWPSRERMVAFPLNRLLSGPRNALDGLRGRPA